MHSVNQINNSKEELSHFYQEIIIDHFKFPRFKGSLMDCRFCQKGQNPLCGDIISLYCKVSTRELHNITGNKAINEVLLGVHFEGTGCSISQASASIMCELVQNKSVKDAKAIIQNAEKIYTGQQKVDPEHLTSDMDALHGVCLFPARIKCAALPWKTLECLIAENFNAHGVPSQSSEKHLQDLKQKRKIRIVTTE